MNVYRCLFYSRAPLVLICHTFSISPFYWLSWFCSRVLNFKFFLNYFARNNELPIHEDLSSAPPNLRLKSRKPFWVFYRNANDLPDLKCRWQKWWENSTVQNKELVIDASVELKGTDLPRRTWLRVNRFRTGHGCCAHSLHRWKFSDSALCKCGETQTMVHIYQTCPIHRFNGTLEDIHNLTPEAQSWIEKLRVDV